MRLAGGDMAFELRIVDDQFPGKRTAEPDWWLVIDGDVQHPRGGWRFRDECLCTDEVARLAGWLEAVAAGTEPEPWCGFIEPNLSFDVLDKGGARALRLSFGSECLPPWAKRGELREEAYVEFQLSELDLTAAVASLRRQLGKFQPSAER